MTARKTQVTSEQLIEQMSALVNHPNCDADTRANMVREAFSIGRAAGRCEGSQEMGERLIATFNNSTRKEST